MEGVSTLERSSRLYRHIAETYWTLRCLYRVKGTRLVTLTGVAKTLNPFLGVRLTPRPRHVLFDEEKEHVGGAIEAFRPRTEEIESQLGT